MFDLSITPDQLTSQEFKDKLTWVTAQGAPANPGLSFLAIGPGAPSSPLPPDDGTWVLTYQTGDKSFVVSAGLTFQHPEITLIILGEIFGFPLAASVIPYRPATVPPAPAAGLLVPTWRPGRSPIGPEIATHPGNFAPLDGDRFPIGSAYTDSTGAVYIKQGWDAGLFGGGTTWWHKL